MDKIWIKDVKEGLSNIMDIIEKLLALSQFGSRWVLWLLIGLSIAALAVVIERAVLFVS